MSNKKRHRRRPGWAPGLEWGHKPPSHEARVLAAAAPALPPGLWHVDAVAAAVLATGSAAIRTAEHAASGHRFQLATLATGEIVAIAGATADADAFLTGKLAAGVTAWADAQHWWIETDVAQTYSAPNTAAASTADQERSADR